MGWVPYIWKRSLFSGFRKRKTHPHKPRVGHPETKSKVKKAKSETNQGRSRVVAWDCVRATRPRAQAISIPVGSLTTPFFHDSRRVSKTVLASASEASESLNMTLLAVLDNDRFAIQRKTSLPLFKSADTSKIWRQGAVCVLKYFL